MSRAWLGQRGQPSPGPGPSPAAPPPEPPPRRGTRALALLGALLGAATAAAVRVCARHAEAQAAARQESMLKTFGTDGLFLFSSLDTDGDMYIGPQEFQPIAEKLTGRRSCPLDPSEETLTIEPLFPETMTKSKDGFLKVSRLTLSGLRNWMTAASPRAVFAARHFQPFLPLPGQELGKPWWIIPSELSVFTRYLSNNRFYPPPPKGKGVIIPRILSMFHPRPFVKTRFAPQGAVATLTAVSDFYYTVVFRIHFTGHVILSKDATHIRDFRLFVPNRRSLNVDMECLYGASESSNMDVDIGCIPQMELEATAPQSTCPWGSPCSFWEEATWRLEVAMYPFKKVSYLPFTEAFHQAKAENKLVHLILLWGALDDHSLILILLKESFISIWSLVKELEKLQSNQENAAQQKLAGLHLEKYSFPVEMMICLPNGTVVHHINANYFLDITSMKPKEIESNLFSFSPTFEDPFTATYMQFLKEGLWRGLPLLQP
uniref:EF-hand domain-containing protein n=1 Tax=Cebus imitator TaxID=2715852 RepID=A0A2K5QXD3_CEBIM